MTYSLLYLDDDPRANAIADGFNTTGYLKVVVEKPTSFEQQIQELLQKQNEFQGLILDLRLDEDQSGMRKAHYTATSLAQHVRSSIGENGWKQEFPIILFTTQPNIEKLYSKDISSHDLFDMILIKDDISNKKIQYQIHALIATYEIVRLNKPNIEKILGIEDLSKLDKRILVGKPFASGDSSVYSYTRFILKELIYVPGPLINEQYLAARLGINIEKSKDWETLKENHLGTTKYKGIYSGAWERWWMYMINDWWEEKIIREPLASLDGRERVNLLSDKLQLKELIVAEPLPKAASYRYWTICQGYEAPLDPREGLRVDSKEPLPWQETKYMSVEAALERVKRESGLKIHPLERERFNQIKKSLS